MDDEAGRDACARDRGLIELDDACGRAANFAPSLVMFEMARLGDAVGRTLAKPVDAVAALPAYDQSAMDGYAIAASFARIGRTRFEVGQRIAAGETPGALAPGGAARILTGAPIPSGCDSVVMQEHVALEGAGIIVDGPVRIGSNIRRRGEDVIPGFPLTRAGERIGPRHVAMFAAQGIWSVPVLMAPRVGIISTGRELRHEGERLEGAVIYDVNRPMLAALASEAGAAVHDAGRVADDPRELASLIRKTAGACDLVVTTGGASVGEEDHSAAAMALSGAEHQVLRIALKPGKPAIIGRIGPCAVLCLPGNPGAALVSWLTLGGAMLSAMMGRTFRLRATARLPCAVRHSRRPGRREFAPARIVYGQNGPAIDVLAKAGSGRLSPLLIADGFADIAAASFEIQAGDPIDFHSFSAGIAAWSCPESL